MMDRHTGSATLLVARNHQDEEEQASYDALAARLAGCLAQPVIPFPIDQSHQSLSQTVADLLRHGIVRMITLPVSLTPLEVGRDSIHDTIQFISRRWPFMGHHLGPPFDWTDWFALVDDLLKDAAGSDTAVILAGHKAPFPHTQSDVAKLARLIYETREVGWVASAHVGETGSTVCRSIRRYQTLSAAKIVVVPYMLFAGRQLHALRKQVDETMEENQVMLLPCLSSGGMLMDRLLEKHRLPMADRSLLPPSPDELEAEILAANGAERQGEGIDELHEPNDYQRTKSKIDAILPPRYRGRTDDVSAAPMSAADLVFDDKGAVLWDQIFGIDDPNNPYCELALAGGPSHLGELLEAVDGRACLAEPGKYAAALDECGRGINMITGMSIVESQVPGWLAVQCDSEEMALWLLRAIIVENVMVHRQGDVIYLPVEPHYTLKDQIKSIVTVTAKTWHYWIEHISFKNLLDAGPP